jgi:hypothetical protein
VQFFAEAGFALSLAAKRSEITENPAKMQEFASIFRVPSENPANMQDFVLNCL